MARLFPQIETRIESSSVTWLTGVGPLWRDWRHARRTRSGSDQ